MGSPLAPKLANLFLGYHERDWLRDYTGIGPQYYRRYVDDVIAVFNNENEACSFLDYLNNRHANIEFTMECEEHKILNFLDVKLDISNVELKTSIHRKSTFSGLLTNYFSFTPMRYKIGMARCLLDRIYKINSTSLGFNCDVKKLFSILSRNAYPRDLCNKIKQNYLDQKGEISTNEENSEPNESYFKLPFIGQKSVWTQKRVNSLISKFCKDVNVKMVFLPFKVGSLFSTKDKLSKMSKPMTVYKFCCARCNSCYIGETTKVPTVRALEHLETDKLSSVYKHLKANPECKAACDISCFTAIDNAETKFKLKTFKFT